MKLKALTFDMKAVSEVDRGMRKYLNTIKFYHFYHNNNNSDNGDDDFDSDGESTDNDEEVFAECERYLISLIRLHLHSIEFFRMRALPVKFINTTTSTFHRVWLMTTRIFRQVERCILKHNSQTLILELNNRICRKVSHKNRENNLECQPHGGKLGITSCPKSCEAIPLRFRVRDLAKVIGDKNQRQKPMAKPWKTNLVHGPFIDPVVWGYKYKGALGSCQV
jgi:hypothetical protein